LLEPDVPLHDFHGHHAENERADDPFFPPIRSATSLRWSSVACGSSSQYKSFEPSVTPGYGSRDHVCHPLEQRVRVKPMALELEVVGKGQRNLEGGNDAEL
jgi:hypothetical protein